MGQRFRRAVDYRVDGQWSKAEAELEVILSEQPDSFSALLQLGIVLRMQRRHEEAVDVHRRAATLYPHSVALLHQLAEDYDAQGEKQVAREIRNRVLRDFPAQSLVVMRRRRDQALVAKAWEKAQRWQEKIEACLRETAEDADLKGDAGVRRGLTYQQGVVLLEKDRPADAAQIFRQLLADEPRFLPAGIMLGEAELLQGNEEAAFEQWRLGFESTGSPLFLQRFEDYFIEAEEPARAIENLRQIIIRSDNNLLPRFFLGRLYYRLEMHEEALRVLKDLAEPMDAAPTYHYLLGRIHRRRNDNDLAMDSYGRCLQSLNMGVASYSCDTCGTAYGEWQDRCDECGTWNSVDLDIRSEQISSTELGLIERPVWGGYGPLDEPAAEPSDDDLPVQ
jgi:predicted Zn-dependent protease